MVALNGFICGLNTSEIGQLEPNSFMSVLQLLQYNAAVFLQATIVCLVYQ